MRRVAVVMALFLGCVAVASPPQGRVWSAVHALHPEPDAAWGVADDVSRLLVGFVSQVDVDDDSVRMLQKVRDACFGLNLKRLLRMLPEGDDETRRLHIVGRPRPGVAYDIGLDETHQLSDTMGALGVSLSLASWGEAPSGHNTYRLGVDASVGTGSIDHVGLLGWIERVLAELHHDLKASGLGLGMLLQRSLPEMYASASRYVSMPRTGRLEGDLMRADVALCADLEREGWKTQRSLARYLKRLDDLLVLQVTFRDVHGNRLIRVGMDSAARCLELEATLVDGTFVPTKPDGRALTERALSLVRTERADVQLDLAGKFHFRGFRGTLTDLSWPMAFSQSAQGAYFVGALTDQPSLVLKGDGAFTSWLVSVMERAFNLEEHTTAMFASLARGPEGKGTLLGLWHTDHVVQFDADTVLVDNGLIRLAAQVVGGRLMPSDAVVLELYEVLSQWISGYNSDYAQIREARQLPSTDAG